MSEHRFHPVNRSDPDDSNRSDLSSGKTDRLAVAVVEDDVFRREVDVQADDTAPPQRGQSPGREPAEQPLICHKYVGVAGAGPASVILHPNPEGHVPVDGLSRLQNDASGHGVEARRRLSSGELERQGPGVVVGLGAITGEALLEENHGFLLGPHISAPSLLTGLSTDCPKAPTPARSSRVIERAPSTADWASRRCASCSSEVGSRLPKTRRSVIPQRSR